MTPHILPLMNSACRSHSDNSGEQNIQRRCFQLKTFVRSQCERITEKDGLMTCAWKLTGQYSLTLRIRILWKILCRRNCIFRTIFMFIAQPLLFSLSARRDFLRKVFHGRPDLCFFTGAIINHQAHSSPSAPYNLIIPLFERNFTASHYSINKCDENERNRRAPRPYHEWLCGDNTK